MKKWYQIPENLDLSLLLKNNGFERYCKSIVLDKFYHLIDRLYIEKVWKTKDWSKFININKATLEKIVGKKFASNIKKILVKVGVLESDNVYCVGSKSIGYRFSKKYRVRFHGVPPFDQKQVARLQRHKELFFKENLSCKPALLFMGGMVDELQLNDIAALKKIENSVLLTNEQRENRRGMIATFGWSIPVTDGAGRFYHTLTNLASDIREFVSIRGEPLYSVDISNSQPALLVTLYQGNCCEKDRLIEVVSKGQFYSTINSFLASPYNLEEKEQKKELKELVFRYIMYGSNYNRNSHPIQSAFRKAFPALSNLIYLKKLRHQRDLAVELQSIEASIVLDSACFSLFERFKDNKSFVMISFHDSILTIKGFIDDVKNTLEKCLIDRLGFSPIIEVKEFK